MQERVITSLRLLSIAATGILCKINRKQEDNNDAWKSTKKQQLGPLVYKRPCVKVLLQVDGQRVNGYMLSDLWSNALLISCPVVELCKVLKCNETL